MTEQHKHQWRPSPDNPNKVACECGAEQYRSKLSDTQIAELTKYERPALMVKAVDILMFAGRGFYTPESFIDEARRMGACKRVPMLPRGVIKGVTRVFLAHEYDTGETDDDDKAIRQSKIFAWFTVRGISRVVGPEVNVEEALKERGVEEYQYVAGSFGTADERGCGNLAIGGTYLLSEEDMAKCWDLAKSSKLEGRIEVIEPPIPTGLKRFRGYKAVDGDLILNGDPEHTWYEAAYEANQLNKTAIAKYKRMLAKWEKVVEEAEG